MKEDFDNTRKSNTIIKNTLMLYIRMFLTMFVTLYTSRVVLSVLGVDDYGIYSVIAGLVVFFSFIQAAMNTSVQRFFNISIGNGDLQSVKKIFNSSLIIYLMIGLIIFLLAEVIGGWYLKNYLNIPSDRYDAAFWVLQTSILSAIILIVQTPYSGMVIAYEKMNFFAYISILEVVAKLLIVFFIKYITSVDSLKLYALLNLVVTFIVLLCYKFFINKNFIASRFDIKLFDKDLSKKILGFSTWNMFGSFANISANQGIALVFNFFFGVAINASLGIANQVSSSIYRFISSFQTAFNPQIIKSYAKSDFDYLRQLLIQTSKFSFYLLLILSLTVLIETKFILFIWLKDIPDYLIYFTKIMILFMLIETLSGPLWSVIYATEHIRKYQISISISLLSSVLLGYIFIKLGLSPTIALSTKIIAALICLVIRLIMIESFLPSFSQLFVRKVLLPILLISVLSPILPYVVFWNLEEGYLRLFLVLCSSVLSCFCFIALFGLSKQEFVFIKQKFLNKFLKK